MSPTLQAIIWFEVQSESLSPFQAAIAGMRLHHRVRLVGRGVDGVELYGCGGEGCVEIADPAVGGLVVLA
jgi:hypothetical protein